MKSTVLLLFLAGLGALSLGCSEPEADLPRLEFPAGMPKEITVGDTTLALTVIKYSADARGREIRDSDYPSFTFHSTDTTVVQVVQGRRLLGLKAGSSAIMAQDDRGSARTPSALIVTVK